MKYDFITVLDRTGADSIAANIDPWGVSPAPAQRIPMWVADMSFPTAPARSSRRCISVSLFRTSVIFPCRMNILTAFSAGRRRATA